MSTSNNAPLEEVLSAVVEQSDSDKVSIGEILDMYGDRSFGPVIMLLGALVVLPPIGAIPGLPMIVGVIIILFSIQIIFGADHIWMPNFIQKQSIERKKLKKAEENAKPFLKRLDRLITERLKWATGSIATYFAAIAVTLMALTLVPLEFVPFAVAAPGFVIMLFGVALVAQDGALMLVGFAGTLAAVLITVFLVPWDKIAGLFG
ncbi:exopolysaccharide biosynthesis protein [Hyphomonas pacifica]|uniref:Uncharacterized protein n=1 Tax=Hyphomonas pacifica TaxID=1280941 RepID=A0A062TTJ7_9PROT|nr:exopolysaccharide biosynthesis protein [Hyphomonas pacifica]KCZ51306.1 hypothetical protein HY2_11635 [Hyphomonas pacifica]RAN33968.1 hypothetical protein HY3_11750 [Hyphomonas pacifica]RAN36615.1 hypothetical protein HY11_11760 [Hyphomonas pacifica]